MKTYLGINISDSTIEAVELKKQGKAYSVLAYSRVKVKAGLLVDSVVQDEVVFEKHLKQLLTSAKPTSFKSKNVVLSVPDSKVFSRQFVFSASLKGKDLEAKIEQEIQGLLPYDLFEILWTYKIVKRDKKNISLLWLGTEKKIIEQFVRSLKKIGYNVVCVESESQALSRLYVDNLVGKKAVCLVDLGAKTVNLSLFDQTGLVSTYTVKGAGDDWTKKIAKQENLSLLKAEKLKKEIGLDMKKKKGKIVLILLKELEKVIKEIKKTVTFYEATKGKAVGTFILTGGSSKLKEIKVFFADNFDAKISFGKPSVLFKGVKVSSTIYSVALGLSLLSDGKSFKTKCVNLLPKETMSAIRKSKEKTRKKEKRLLLVFVVVFFLLVVLIGAVYYRQREKEKRLKEQEVLQEIPVIRQRKINLDFNLDVKVTSEHVFKAEDLASLSYQVIAGSTSHNDFIDGLIISGIVEKTDVFGVTGKKTIANKDISILISDDLKRADTKIMADLEYDFLVSVLEHMGNISQTILVNNAVEVKKVRSYADTQVGSIGNSFTYTLKAKVKALLLNRAEVYHVAEDKLQLKLESKQQVSDFNLEDLQVTVVDYNELENMVKINVKTIANLNK